MAQNLLESAVVTSLPEALVNGFPRPKALWEITPFGALAQNPEDAVKHLTVAAPWKPHALRRGKRWLRLLPSVRMKFHNGLP